MNESEKGNKLIPIRSLNFKNKMSIAVTEDE